MQIPSATVHGENQNVKTLSKSQNEKHYIFSALE